MYCSVGIDDADEHHFRHGGAVLTLPLCAATPEAALRFTGKPLVSRVLAAFAAMLFGHVTLTVAADSTGSSTQAMIVMRPALEIATDEGPAYKVDFSYRIPGHDLVRLKGVGIVAAVGEMSYITSDPRIEFLDPLTNESLASATVTDPVRLMGGAPFDLPDLRSFSDTYTTGRWVGEAPFLGHALQVLNVSFRYGYRIIQEGTEHYLATTFTEVPGVPKPLTAEVALLIEFSALSDPHDTEFRVRYSARERRSHSDWRTQLTADSRTFVAKVLQEFVVRLQTPD